MKLAVLLISTLLLATGVEAGKKILHLGVALSMAAEHWPLAKPATVPSLDSVFRAIGLTEDEQVAFASALRAGSQAGAAQEFANGRSGAQRAFLRVQAALHASGELPLAFGAGMGTFKSIVRRTVHKLHMEMQPLVRRLSRGPYDTAILPYSNPGPYPDATQLQ
jgi:hypothetical protein